MAEEDEYKYYDPGKEDHRKVKEAVKQYIVRREEKIDEKEVAEEVNPILSDLGIEYTKGHTRNLLSDIRKMLKEDDILEVEKDARGGIKAIVYLPKS